MRNKLGLILQQELEFTHDLPILVGVSGGPDSLALVYFMLENDYPVIIAHFNHKLRSGADADAEFVAEFAHSQGATYKYGEQNVLDYAYQEKLSVEDAARRLRYRFLFEAADRAGAQAVLVGHTADDQAETILLRLLRGTGLDGLTGMQMVSDPNQWSDHIPLVRPLITSWRNEIEAYLLEHDLVPRRDESNRDQGYLRNRIRLTVIPRLQEINPNLPAGLVRMAAALQGDQQIIQQAVDNAWNATSIQLSADAITYRRELFVAHTLGLQRRLLIKGIQHLVSADQTIRFDVIQQGIASIQKPVTHDTIELMPGVNLVLDDDKIWLVNNLAQLPHKSWPQLESADIRGFEFYIPTGMQLSGGWWLFGETVNLKMTGMPAENDLIDPYQAWFAADQVELPLIVRGRLPGDRIQPYGMDGHRIKISDLMINMKIPQSARTAWPVVAAGDKILWLPGLRRGEGVEVAPQTQVAYHLWLQSGD